MSGRWWGDLGERAASVASACKLDLACGPRCRAARPSGSRFEGDLFADFYPPQTFALSGRWWGDLGERAASVASACKLDLACGPRCRAARPSGSRVEGHLF